MHESARARYNAGMGARERVREALAGPTGEAEKLLNELRHGSTEERLTILIDGWCRGIAGALEELAISIDALERSARLRPVPDPESRRVPDDA